MSILARAYRKDGGVVDFTSFGLGYYQSDKTVTTDGASWFLAQRNGLEFKIYKVTDYAGSINRERHDVTDEFDRFEVAGRGSEDAK